MITTNSVFVMILSVLLLCLTISTPSTIAKTANKKPNSLSLKLLHRSSIPLVENENFQDFLENNKQLYLNDSKFFTTAPLFQATTGHVYFVNLSIGEPPVPQYLAVDTGSSVVWVDANSRNKRFYYKPGYSSTYKNVNCSSPECSLSRRFRCTKDICLYQLNYGNDINLSFGYLGLERFVFSDGGYLDKVLFGVATTTKGLMFGSPNFNGMLGLGPQPSSLLLRSFSRKKFSYCIDDIFNSSSQLSFLELGEIDDWDYGDDSMYVPLNHDEYYRIDMDCIEFMETCLGGFNRDIFKYNTSNPYTGVIFDTGAVFTFLADEAYNALADNVARFMRSKGFVEPQNKDTQMCYKGQREEISDFPLVSFHFIDEDFDADLRLRLENGSLFYNSDRFTFCMTMIKSSSKSILYKDFTVVGLMAQQNHTILFDLEASRVSIHYTSCQS